MITTVMLDIDNTLLDFDRCAAFAMQTAMSDRGLAWSEGVFRVFNEVNRYLWQQIEKSLLTKEELYRVRWQMIFDRLGISEDGQAFETLFLKYLRESHVPVTGAMELLAYLSERYRLCAASNAPAEQQLHRLELAGMRPYFEYLFISGEIGHPKPSRAFFDACFERMGHIRREEVMLIGDSLTADIKGGMDYGIRTCWYNPDRLAEDAGVKPDHTVHTLMEIMNIL